MLIISDLVNISPIYLLKVFKNLSKIFVSSPEKLSLNIGPVAVLRDGEPVEDYREEKASAVMLQDRFTLEIILGDGPGRHSILTTDLTEEYVRINAEYRT